MRKERPVGCLWVGDGVVRVEYDACRSVTIGTRHESLVSELWCILRRSVENMKDNDGISASERIDMAVEQSRDADGRGGSRARESYHEMM